VFPEDYINSVLNLKPSTFEEQAMNICEEINFHDEDYKSNEKSKNFDDPFEGTY
jgi:hypothetical protein